MTAPATVSIAFLPRCHCLCGGKTEEMAIGTKPGDLPHALCKNSFGGREVCRQSGIFKILSCDCIGRGLSIFRDLAFFAGKEETKNKHPAFIKPM